MKKWHRLASVCVLGLGGTVWGQATTQPQTTTAPVKPAITTLPGSAGELLRKWYAEGTAAGNTGDTYDNRDRGHSLLDLKLFPQLTPLTYTEDEKKANADWAGAVRVHPPVVLGNSSTAAPPTSGGCNVRMYYSQPPGLMFLFTQYSQSNLYVYPAHHDWIVGHNGNPIISDHGFGDLLPANTPYVIVSEGSSYGDMVFVQAVAATLGAFRPEVKKKLISRGILMPTVQMIFRASNKPVVKPEDYLTGVAHPSCFPGGTLEVPRMVQMAHDMTVDKLPPICTIQLLEKDPPAPGREYFDTITSETLSESPCAISHIYRSTAFTRRFVISAQKSGDPNSLPIKIHWVVLRGDAKLIQISPRDPQGVNVEVVIQYHPRAPIAPGNPMESNRVDIAAIVHNGLYYSPPAIFTDFTLDNEGRTYDASGHILEVGYGLGESYLPVANAGQFLDRLLPKPVPADNSPAAIAATLLAEAYTPAQVAALVPLLEKSQSFAKRLEMAQAYLKEARASKVQKDIDTAQSNVTAAQKLVDDPLAEHSAALGGALKEVLPKGLSRLAADPTWIPRHAPELTTLLQAATPQVQKKLAAERARLVTYGLIQNTPGMNLSLTPLRAGGEGTGGGATPPEAQLTDFEKSCLTRYQADLLAELVCPGGVQHLYRINYVDPNLAGTKSWRDVYHYDAAGHLTGWTRYDLDRRSEFTAAGEVVLERDDQGRCIKAGKVRYERVRGAHPDRGAEYWAYWGPIKQVLTSETVRYGYDGPKDEVGHVVPTTTP